ncbi:MAG: hypothetical protein Q4A07_05830 [Coriobacteriales bacterium]|nr:hypothetical protein [Coriobacteriales bacterium]
MRNDVAKRRTNSMLRDHPALCVVLVLLTGLRVVLAHKTPLISSMAPAYDDRLLVQYASNIVQGNWLGAYNVLTLTKNPGYALFIAACHGLHVRYQLAYILLYIAACAVCCTAIRPLVPSRVVRSWLYVALMYAPAFLTLDYFQRMYRMGIVLPLTMLVFSAYIGLYLRRAETLPRIVPWSVCAGLGMAGLWICTESAMWVLPFVAVCSLVVLVGRIAACANERRGVAWMCAWVALLALPMALLVSSTVAVRATNQRSYGVSLLNDRYQGGFSRASAAIMSIDTGNELELVWLPTSALELAMQNSATLRSERESIMNAWDARREEFAQKEITGDLSYWTLRQGYADAGGYQDARKTDAFWNAVADEVEQAYSTGKLRRRSGLYISAAANPIPWDGVTTHIEDSLKWMLDLCTHTTMSNQIIAASSEPAAGTGTLEDQELALTLAGGNVLMGTPPEDETTEAEQKNTVVNTEILRKDAIFLNIDHILGVIGVRVGAVLALCLLVVAPVLAIVLLVKRDKSRLEFLLVLAGLLLSAFVLVFSVTWAMDFAWAGSETMHQWAIFSYSAPFYALLMMTECIVYGKAIACITLRR